MKSEPNNSKMVGRYSCDVCGSSDANTLFDDGHMWCFSCNKLTQPPTDKVKPMMQKRMTTSFSPLPDLKDTKVGSLKDRSIKKETLQFYDVRLDVCDGVVMKHYYPYTTKDGDIVAYKIRTEPKGFDSKGPIGKATFFGASKFSNSGKYLTICEGEIDTMAVYQMMGSKYPTVGVRSATSAYKDAKKNFEWVDSFDNIIICFDNDDAGKNAAKEVASLFPKKCKVVKLNKKDAGKYLEEKDPTEFNRLWWAAEQFKPDDILSGQDIWDAIKDKPKEAIFTYPWEALQNITYGMREGEFIIITAGTGIGKTNVLREISHHILKSTDANLGVIYLEEGTLDTAHGLMTCDASIPFHLPDAVYTDEEYQIAFKNTWGTNRVYTLGERFRDNSVDYLVDKIKFLVRGCDCKFLILDHISFMVSDNPGDERKMLDEIGHKLKAIAVELGIVLCAVAHSRRQATKPLEEGGITSLSDLRGTAGLGQLANFVFGLERNGQAQDEQERNTTLIRVLKNRFSGLTGPTSYLYFNKETGRLTELNKEGKE